MVLFSILVFPLTAIWFLTGQGTGRHRAKMSGEYSGYFLHGMLFMIPSLFLVKFLTSFLSRTYSMPNIFLYHFFVDYIYFHIFSIASCLFRFRDMMFRAPDERITHYFMFFSGFYFALALYSGLVSYGEGDVYTLFILPVARVVIALLTTMLIVFSSFTGGLERTAYVFSVFLLAVGGALTAFFFYAQMPYVSLLVLLLLFILIYYLHRIHGFDI